MLNVRKIVQDRMKRLGLNAYAVAKLVDGKVADQTVYNFIKGRSGMNTDSLGHLLAALDLRIIGEDELAELMEVGAEVAKHGEAFGRGVAPQTKPNKTRPRGRERK